MSIPTREELLKIGPASLMKGLEVVKDQVAEVPIIKGSKTDVFRSLFLGGGHIGSHPEGGFTPFRQPLFPGSVPWAIWCLRRGRFGGWETGVFYCAFLNGHVRFSRK